MSERDEWQEKFFQRLIAHFDEWFHRVRETKTVYIPVCAHGTTGEDDGVTTG